MFIEFAEAHHSRYLSLWAYLARIRLVSRLLFSHDDVWLKDYLDTIASAPKRSTLSMTADFPLCEVH